MVPVNSSLFLSFDTNPKRYEVLKPNEKFGSIDIYLTGGDIRYFDIPQKNNIFAVENLTILGAVEIFKLNAL